MLHGAGMGSAGCAPVPVLPLQGTLWSPLPMGASSQHQLFPLIKTSVRLDGKSQREVEEAVAVVLRWDQRLENEQGSFSSC